MLVGAPGVGKTSLVRRFVHQVFSDSYRSTLGVKVDRKTVSCGGTTVVMLLWDTHGETKGLDVPENYLRGAAAVLAVVDATAPETTAVAESMVARLRAASPGASVWFAENKSDLTGTGQCLTEIGVPTSAKTGVGVEDLFFAIADELATGSG